MIGVQKAHAQMEAAEPVKWDLTQECKLNISQDALWVILTDVKQLAPLSNGFVSSITDKGKNARVVTFADGSKRTENVTQSDTENKFMVIEFSKESLPEGISDAQIAIFTREQNDKSTLVWRVRITGKDKSKQSLIARLKEEFSNYQTGFVKNKK